MNGDYGDVVAVGVIFLLPCDLQYVEENLGVMSVGFLLSSPSDAVIWRGPKKNGAYSLAVSLVSSLFSSPFSLSRSFSSLPPYKTSLLQLPPPFLFLSYPHCPFSPFPLLSPPSPLPPLSSAGLIKQFLRDVDWGEVDYLVVDTPPGTSDEHISVVQYLSGTHVDGAVLVTTPQASNALYTHTH